MRFYGPLTGKEAKLVGKVVGYVGHTWEVECGVNGCVDEFAVLAAGVTKGRVTEILRAHYNEEHDG